MYYAYVIHSQKDRKFYTGFTRNLPKRIKGHNDGRVNSTAHRIPFELVYWEGCLEQKDACTERSISNRLGAKDILRLGSRTKRFSIAMSSRTS